MAKRCLPSSCHDLAFLLLSSMFGNVYNLILPPPSLYALMANSNLASTIRSVPEPSKLEAPSAYNFNVLFELCALLVAAGFLIFVSLSSMEDVSARKSARIFPFDRVASFEADVMIALMLSIEVARYITNTPPLIRARPLSTLRKELAQCCQLPIEALYLLECLRWLKIFDFLNLRRVSFYSLPSDEMPKEWAFLNTKGFSRCMLDAESQIICDNTNGNTTLGEAQGVSLQITFGMRTYELTKDEFTHFLSLYPIPSEYHVMLPKRNQTIFDAPDGLNPFGCAKLTTFIVMCKAYGCEPSVDLFRGFFNSFSGDSVVPANCSKLLFKNNRWDTKSFADKLPDNIHENPYFQRLEMAFRNFMYAETDDGLTFLPNDPLLEFRTGSPSVSINTEPSIAEAVPTGQLGENTDDSWGSSLLEQLVIHTGSVATRIKERKSTSAKVAASKDDSSFLTISDDDEGFPDVLELQNANACHLKIFAITPLA
uniref:Uncharacterized protein n=1 Tax=Tanacetum cinerariifolium TaxID=118510 RepID=A0A699I5U4_TANCI|nr:hypothetical protein [Tanacetum cinerariifolium]